MLTLFSYSNTDYDARVYRYPLLVLHLPLQTLTRFELFTTLVLANLRRATAPLQAMCLNYNGFLQSVTPWTNLNLQYMPPFPLAISRHVDSSPSLDGTNFLCGRVMNLFWNDSLGILLVLEDY